MSWVNAVLPHEKRSDYENNFIISRNIFKIKKVKSYSSNIILAFSVVNKVIAGEYNRYGCKSDFCLLPDRYNSGYSGGIWIAAFFPDVEKLERTANGGDVECREYWENGPEKGVAAANTIPRAIARAAASLYI